MDAAVASSRAEFLAAEAPSSCFHCGEPNPPGHSHVADIAGRSHRFCCAGCVAIALTIDGAGLAPFYAQRTEGRARPVRDEAGHTPEVEAALAAGLVREVQSGTHEASLLLDGLTCGACAWLVESWLRRQPAVVEATVNYATRRARVRWQGDPRDLVAVLGAVGALGYRAFVYDPAQREALLRRETRSLLLRMGVALLAMMQVMMLATPAYLGETIERDYQALLDGAALLLTLPVVLYCALPFYRGAWRSLRGGRPGMDVPVVIGIAGAFAASVWSLATGSAAVYFDSVTMFVALLLVARYADGLAREKAVAAIEQVTRELPPVAVRLARHPAPDRGETVAAHALRVGDAVRVDAGATVPVDGVVLSGASVVEEALLTGEAMPLPKGRGATVLAGSVNRGNPLVVRATATGAGTTLASLARLVERAAEARPPGVALADRAASWFVTGLLGVALAAGAYWALHDPARALPIVFAVLVVSCPCALSLATPAAMAFATGTLGRQGIVAARGDALETLARVTHVVLDKTGTLTRGMPRLVRTESLCGANADTALELAASLEAGMAHPLAAALRDAAAALPVPPATDVEIEQGDGVTGTIHGVRYRLGRPAWAWPGAMPQAGDESATLVLLASDRGPCACFALDDAERPEAAALVRALTQQGIALSLVSGDRAACVERVARSVGIADAHSDARPTDKCAFVQARQAEGAVVAMIGDGLNDAPALAQADVSIAFGDASALARWSADLVVPGHDLGRVDVAFALARRTRAVIRQNLAWAAAYNLVAIPLAVAGLVSPLVAAVGMSLSSLLVVGNALRLGRVEQSG